MYSSVPRQSLATAVRCRQICPRGLAFQIWYVEDDGTAHALLIVEACAKVVGKLLL